MQDVGKRAIGKLQDFFYGQMMDAEIYGRTFIPHNRQTIVIANHASHLDMGFVRHALGKYGEDIVSLAAQDYFFDRGSLKRTFFENLTNLKRARSQRRPPRERTASKRSAPTRAHDAHLPGRHAAAPDGELHEFKPLLGHLSLANNIDILPAVSSAARATRCRRARAFPRLAVFLRGSGRPSR